MTNRNRGVSPRESMTIVKGSLFLFLACMGFSEKAMSGDIHFGWSSQTTISTMTSNYTATLINLAGVADGCGGADFWVLPLDSTDASRFKRAALLGAFLAGKRVILRCENSIISDFQIFN